MPADGDASEHKSAQAIDEIVFRHPERADGQAVNELIASVGALDENSLYCNFLQCTHFSSTCMLAELNGEAVGWVSGYRPPEHDDTLFVWQVAVSEKARGRGLAKRLIRTLLDSEGCRDVRFIRTTITADNTASWKTFGGIAEQLDAPVTDKVWLCEEEHFGGQHDSEHMLTIGPFGAMAEETSDSTAAQPLTGPTQTEVAA